jgi:putative exosortase-associated protein (TIGR04073 family)
MKSHRFLAGCAAMAILGAGAAFAGGCPDEATPESVIEKMSVKLVRGIVNVVTAPLEIPKQIYTTTRDMGVPGPLIGLLKGVGMTGYRAVFGTLETGFFLIPAPGYYDPMVTPGYVWQGWAPPPQAAPAPEAMPAPEGAP